MHVLPVSFEGKEQLPTHHHTLMLFFLLSFLLILYQKSKTEYLSRFLGLLETLYQYV